MAEFEDFEESVLEYENEEEEEIGELIVIDDELIDSLKEGVESANPLQLAQSVDVILGYLGYKENITIEEDLQQNPLKALLPILIQKLIELFNTSNEGTAKKHKVTNLLEMLTAGIFDSFDKFKKELELFTIFCTSIKLLKSFAEEKLAERAFITAAKLGMKAEAYKDQIYDLFSELLPDEKLGPTVLQMQYSELANAKESSAIESSLPRILDFYVEHRDFVLSYVKSLTKRTSSELIDTMSQSDKSMISWRILATMQLISQYTIQTKEQRLVYPIGLILTSFLRHFPIKAYLPFQIRIANILIKISHSFEKFEPILGWATESIEFICSNNCKPGPKFDWETQLTSPPHFTFEFSEKALQQILRIFFSVLFINCESIAFPEYAMPILKRLEKVRSGKGRFANEINPLVKQLTEQVKILTDMKQKLVWTTREEQYSEWKKAIEANPTPMKIKLTKESKIEAAKERMKRQEKPKKKEDASGITIEVATVDDV